MWSCDNSLHGFSPRLATHFRPVAVGSDPEKGHLEGWFSTLDRCLRHQRSGRSADRTRLFRSHAWEAVALPLSYTRSNPRGWTHCPRRGKAFAPSGWSVEDLSRDRLPRRSQHAFASGRSLHPLSAPLQRSIRFICDPLPTTASEHLAAIFVCRAGQTLCWVYPVPHGKQEKRGFRLFAGDRAVSVSAPSTQISDHLPSFG